MGNVVFYHLRPTWHWLSCVPLSFLAPYLDWDSLQRELVLLTFTSALIDLDPYWYSRRLISCAWHCVTFIHENAPLIRLPDACDPVTRPTRINTFAVYSVTSWTQILHL